MATKNKPHSETSGRELFITRLLDAPRELVWEAWTNPEHIRHWWGPDGFTNTIHKMEVKPGGAWEFIMHGPDGTDYKNKSIFLEVVKPERIVYEHITGPKFTTTVTFSEEGDKTRLHMTSLFESAEQLQQAIKVFKADAGLKQTIGRLESYALQIKVTEGKPLIFERDFNAPAAMVWAAITDPDHMKQWYFDIPGFKAEVGFEFTMLSSKDPEHPYLHLCKVTEVVPGKKLAYSWRYDGYPGNSIVTFELFADGDKTRLKLTHEGVESFAHLNPDLAVSNFVEGWTHIINITLKDYLESKN